jgi:hypothetical protein
VDDLGILCQPEDCLSLARPLRVLSAFTPDGGTEGFGRTNGEFGGNPDGGSACGEADGDPTPVRIGPGETGGKTGMSIVSVLPSASSFVPAVIAAKVGTDAIPTSSATISTYRRVGPEKPASARYTPLSRFRMIFTGGARLSSGWSGTAGVLPDQ